MPSCVVKWCKSHTISKCFGITFHYFPKDPVRRYKWIAAVQLERQDNNWKPMKTSRVCSIHFDEKDYFISPKGYTMLHRTAVPVCTMVRPEEKSTSLRENEQLQMTNENSSFEKCDYMKETNTAEPQECKAQKSKPVTNKEFFLPRLLKVAGIGSENYYRDSPHWMKFELDLIRFIKNDHSIIYSNVDNLDKHQRAVKVREAWNAIGQKFKEVSVGYIRMKWKSIVTDYYKVTNNCTYDNVKNEKNLPKDKKLANEPFSFLNDHLDFCIQDLEENSSDYENLSFDFDTIAFSPSLTSENMRDAEVDNSASSHVIKQLNHEEVDVDENDAKFNMEIDDDENTLIVTTYSNSITNTTEEEIIPDNIFGMEDTATNKASEPQKKWEEEELMNATHLTKEMIQELLSIKLKQYYTAPMNIQ